MYKGLYIYIFMGGGWRAPPLWMVMVWLVFLGFVFPPLWMVGCPPHVDGGLPPLWMWGPLALLLLLALLLTPTGNQLKHVFFVTRGRLQAFF